MPNFRVSDTFVFSLNYTFHFFFYSELLVPFPGHVVLGDCRVWALALTGPPGLELSLIQPKGSALRLIPSFIHISLRCWLWQMASYVILCN